ncbi:MAG: 2-phospho-L-lactate guanylyltransferase [Myxococcota bacterium]
MTTWALVPIKGFDRAKSRLSEVLSPPDRAKLARSFVEHVLRVLKASPGIDEVAVVSDSEDARALARELGAVTLEDPLAAEGFAAIVDDTLGELEARGADAVVVCMSDLPELEREDIESVVRALSESDVVLVPDRLGEGTNVIAVTPPTVLPSCLGHRDSLNRHLRRARELGLTVSVQLSSGIAFDVDHPSDLDRLRAR